MYSHLPINFISRHDRIEWFIYSTSWKT